MIKKNFLYRLIQVSFGIGVLLSIFLAVNVWAELYPRDSVDMELSLIRCVNGKTYSFKEAKISSFQSSHSDQGVTIVPWLEWDEKKAQSLCELKKQKDNSNSQIISADEFTSTKQQFKKEVITRVVGSYKGAAVRALIALIILLVVLYFIRETLLYLFFNKVFFQRVKNG